ncbi:MAG: hypothetical protein AAFN92_07775, partial [Bacteroidota bacterium]
PAQVSTHIGTLCPVASRATVTEVFQIICAQMFARADMIDFEGEASEFFRILAILAAIIGALGNVILYLLR